MLTLSMLVLAGASRAETSACSAWPNDKSQVLDGRLCVLVAKASEERPVYHASADGQNFRFLFTDSGLALLLNPEAFALVISNPEAQARLLKSLPPPRLDFWRLDALYWARWLGSF